MSMARLVTKEVIEPLGLDTVYPTSAPLPSSFSHGYYAGPEAKYAKQLGKGLIYEQSFSYRVGV